jgi:hypothetical protein
VRSVPKRHWWIAGFGVVACAWLIGWAFWGRDGNSGISYFTASSGFVIAVLGLPLALVAGLLMSRDGLRSLGGVVLSVATLVMAYAAWFVFFGGVCLDETDVCVTDWPSRIATLLTSAAVFGAGYLTQRTLSSRRGS